MTKVVDYIANSEHYLKRARKRLDENSAPSLFYAAFELRCGVESRMQEYLEAQDHISKVRKKGWKISKLGQNLEHAFQSGDKIAELSIRSQVSGKLIFHGYYTPVTKSLRKNTESLNAYMHAPKQPHPLTCLWWDNFRKLLETVYMDLEIANRGTLMGPPILNRKNSTARTSVTVIDIEEMALSSMKGGDKIIVDMKYHATFPSLEKSS